MHVAFVGNYPPRQCGIATFTQHLADGLASAGRLRAGRGDLAQAPRVSVVALNDPGQDYDYPDVVADVIRQDHPRDYLRAADALNRQGVDCVVLQHEYGIFGGEAGEYVVRFAERLNRPLVVTMHTVLRQPNDPQRLVTMRLARVAARVVVMSELAVRILRDVYRVPAERIARIEHGAPAFDYGRRDEARRSLGLDGGHTLLTFGLLGRGKGIETAIEALPALREAAPDFTYVLLGKTHPHVIAREGEAYRESLWARVEELGLTDNVRFDDRYVDEATLGDYLLAADTYVLPYPNEAQITSGTLQYAVSAGCAVVSTPFWHARELLAEGRGLHFPFGDHAALAERLAGLIAEPERHAELRARARAYGEAGTWQRRGGEYLSLAETLAEAHPRTSAKRLRLRHARELPRLDLQHVVRMTDDTGMLQHATYHLPNRHEGYCLDDNARACIYVAQCLEAGAPARQLEPLLDRYLGLMHYLQRPDGRFVNFLGYDRAFLEEVGSEDSFGRAVWTLGYLLSSEAVSQDHKDLAWQLYLRSRPHLAELRSLRAVAFACLGLCRLCGAERYSEGVRELLAERASFLEDEFAAASDEEWAWYESVLTYGNAILPLASLEVGRALDSAAHLRTARAATDFLEQHTFAGGTFRPVGCHTFMRRGGNPCAFDQQPLEAMAMVMLYAAWHEHTGDERDLERAVASYEWFTGRNDLGLPVFHAERGSCYDGLMEWGLNQNQGAESLLAYWLARGSVAEAMQRADPRAAETGVLADDARERQRDPLPSRAARVAAAHGTPVRLGQRGSVA